MRRRHPAALLVAATALAPALLLTPSAVAAAPKPAAAATAAAATDTPVDEMSEDDLRIAVLRILADKKSGKAVVREANKALDARTADALRSFLKTGYRLAQAEDDTVTLFSKLVVATKNDDQRVIKEINKLLEDRNPEDMRAWLDTGYRLAQAEDDTVYIFRLLANPNSSKALRAAAEAALSNGSPEALRYFREVGQYKVARR
ncbi:hypothetical protein ABZ330_07840 [Streptomyces sp. NPDC006172]|uniref:hypothetical protein n=1 Tax=Streptomyces sp. NPDC006172 TaxID=3154470 RepID=UPI0033F77BBD